MKKILLSKILKKNIKSLVVDNSLFNIIFTDSNELFVNKIDGNLIKISDVFMTNTIDMYKIAEPNAEKLYICDDTKSIYIWNGVAFDMISGGDSDTVKALEKGLSDHLISYGEFTLSNVAAMKTISEAIDKLMNDANTLSTSVTQAFSDVSDLITSINNSLSSIKDDMSDVEIRCDAFDMNIETINNTITDINTDIKTMQASILDLDNRVETLELSVTKLEADVSAVTKNTDAIKLTLSEKFYNVEFNIVDSLSNQEVLDTVDLGSFIFDATQTLTMSTITLKTTVVPTDYIEVEINHRTVGTTGTITDKVIGVVGLSKDQITNVIAVPNSLIYTDGLLVAKVTSSGNFHKNLRIIVKIKKHHTT